MPTSLKEATRGLFTRDQIGTYWNDLYVDVKTCLDYHFTRRLRLAHELVCRGTDRSARVLDLGCGSGVLSELLVESGYKVDASDMSEDMLEFAGKKLERFDPSRYHLFRSECENLEAEDETYDVVACIGVFGYMDDVDAAIAQIYRVLKPGGRLVMSIRNFDHLRVFDFYNWLRMVFVKLPLRIFKKIQGKSYIDVKSESQGLKIESADGRKNLINIWDKPKRVISIFEEGGFKSVDFYGEGYGPLTFKGKRFLPHRVDKFVSKSLSNLFRLLRLEKRTCWYADISVYVFTKPQGDGS